MFFATLLSRLFDPPVVITVLTLVAVAISNLTTQGTTAILILLPFMLGGPLVYFLWKLKTHQVSNWDISNRKERVHPLFILLGFIFLDILALTFIHNTFLLHVFMLYFLWTLGFLLITIFWKISGHSGIATLAYLLLIKWFGMQLWPLIIVVFLISWARVIRKDHTLHQVIAGFIYSIAVFSFWTIVTSP